MIFVWPSATKSGRPYVRVVVVGHPPPSPQTPLPREPTPHPTRTPPALIGPGVIPWWDNLKTAQRQSVRITLGMGAAENTARPCVRHHGGAIPEWDPPPGAIGGGCTVKTPHVDWHPGLPNIWKSTPWEEHFSLLIDCRISDRGEAFEIRTKVHGPLHCMLHDNLDGFHQRVCLLKPNLKCWDARFPSG